MSVPIHVGSSSCRCQFMSVPAQVGSSSGDDFVLLQCALARILMICAFSDQCGRTEYVSTRCELVLGIAGCRRGGCGTRIPENLPARVGCSWARHCPAIFPESDSERFPLCVGGRCCKRPPCLRPLLQVAAVALLFRISFFFLIEILTL
jgi:hypothetical protein